MEHYTSGRWSVKEGREEEFVEAWEEFARWSVENIEGARWARFVQHKDDPSQLLSLGAWEDDAAIEAWRSDPGFSKRIGNMQELLADSEVATFTLRASAGTDD